MNHFIRFIAVVWNLCSNSVRCLQLRYIQNKWKCIVIFGIPFSQNEFISFFPLRCFLCKRAPCTLRGRNKHYYWSKELLYWRFTQPHRAKLDIGLPWLYSISRAFSLRPTLGQLPFRSLVRVLWEYLLPSIWGHTQQDHIPEWHEVRSPSSEMRWKGFKCSHILLLRQCTF